MEAVMRVTDAVKRLRVSKLGRCCANPMSTHRWATFFVGDTSELPPPSNRVLRLSPYLQARGCEPGCFGGPFRVHLPFCDG